MGDLVTRLIVLGVIGAALLWVAHGVVSHFESKGRAKEAAVWKPQLEAAQTQIGRLKAEADGARADLAQLRTDYQAQAAAVEKLGADAAARQAQVKKLLADIAARATRYQAEIESLTSIATGPPTPLDVSCESADRVLRALAADRVR